MGWFADMCEGMSYLNGLAVFATITRNLLVGPTHTFWIPVDCPWTFGEITATLWLKGVRSWDHTFFAGYFKVTVKRSQARWAQHVLDRNGIPVAIGRFNGDIQ